MVDNSNYVDIFYRIKTIVTITFVEFACIPCFFQILTALVHFLSKLRIRSFYLNVFPAGKSMGQRSFPSCLTLHTDDDR